MRRMVEGRARRRAGWVAGGALALLTSGCAWLASLTGNASQQGSGAGTATASVGAAGDSADQPTAATLNARFGPEHWATTGRGTRMARIPGGRWVRPRARGVSAGSEVQVEPFEMDETEVTTAQYEECVAAGVCPPSPGGEDTCNTGRPSRANHPMNCVTHPGARAFCAWVGKRLPTELEWEYAGGGVAEPPTLQAGSVCVSLPDQDRHPGTCAVGTSPGDQSEYGVLDLRSNVREWTEAEDLGSEWAALRGGSWLSELGSSDFVVRHTAGPKWRAATLGFRCARTADRAATPPSSAAPSRGPDRVAELLGCRRR